MKNEVSTCRTINITEAKDLIETGKVIVADIRDRESFLQSHIPDAVHLTQDNLEEFKKNTAFDETVIIYCFHGNNSKGAAQFFTNMGYENIYSLDGGFSEYSKYNF